ncbi:MULTISPECIES: zinc-dependent alcohol dehydrogenase family protein [Cyanophyceae]|uniref:zinc-dependent alcohol dehydrogenase family protein n=1 Tax=Cyanophyceae TaxID=3028117 RepID=UPI00168910F9|nr:MULTISPECIES: zinc-dependent alcohol dehydrogenase family protein [Cyanophyceae]MBD1918332.1 zinc-dependent alcohol dehydrogenase family protein [Phormidium sp. FACHB-77]MBD2028799.1 zinc-dependent alcohol dehydrogenase family protein [Phormidium sp. FACHB-322]MBD2051220.1 zinc-dependent alcohol dehydrogenase family protein [Leptolyngbya sp. FACHB-60]
MKAIVIQQFGNPNVFQPTEVPTPELVQGHLLIRVAATSVNPVDVKIREGAVADIAPVFPAILHGDVAGVVEAVGEGVTHFQIGDEVYGCVGGVKGTAGALAEYVLADADLVAHKPRSLTMTETAALPLVSITAWEGLIDRAQIQANQRVLVYGSTGGVGHIGVQLAKWAGAKVYALVSSEEKAKLAHQLGADITINYHQTSVEELVAEHTNGEGFDVVFDTVGNDNLQNAFKAAKLNGTIVSLVSLSQQDLTLLHAKGLTLHLVYMLLPLLFGGSRAYHSKILTRVAQLVDEGQVRPLMDSKSFSFGEVAAAHTHAASGSAVGKVVLKQSL